MPTSQIKAYLGATPLFTEGGGGGGPAEWVRPADWEVLPTLVSGVDHEVVGLFAVGDHGSNFVAFRCAGATTIDWGDGGATENVAANVTAQHNYVYADLGVGTEFALGGSGETYRQAIVSIVPQAANNLTSINFDYKHSQAGLNAYRTPWLDISVCAASCTSLTFGGTSGNLTLLERTNMVSVGAITNGNNMFLSCSALQSVPLFNLSSMTSGVNMFALCISLQSIPLFNFGALTNGSGMFQFLRSAQSLPLFNLSAMTDGNNMFGSCLALQSVPAFNLSAMTNGSSMFGSCSSLQSVPAFNLSAMTSGASMFGYCSALQSVGLLNLSAMTNGASMFSSCLALQSLPLFNLSAMTAGSNMFAGCTSLQSLPLFNLSAMTNGNNMFGSCATLQSVPAFNLSAMTTGTTMFASCSSLARCRATGIKDVISFASCKMSATQLNELYTNLATVTAKTITASGNWGYAASDPTIATAKGWTVN